MLYYHIGVGRPLLMLPVVVARASSFSPRRPRCCWRWANLFYRDVKYLFEIVITVWMFADLGGSTQSVASAAGSAPSSPLNPMTHHHRRLSRGSARPADARAGLPSHASLAAILMLAGAWVMFHRAEFDFAENI